MGDGGLTTRRIQAGAVVVIALAVVLLAFASMTQAACAQQSLMETRALRIQVDSLERTVDALCEALRAAGELEGYGG